MSASNHSSYASQQPPGNKPVGIDFNDPEWRAIEPGEESMSRPLQLTSLIACAELRQVIEKDHLVFEDRSNQKELRRIDDFLKIIKRDLRSDSTTQQALRSGVYFARHDFKATDIYRDCFKLGSKKSRENLRLVWGTLLLSVVVMLRYPNREGDQVAMMDKAMSAREYGVLATMTTRKMNTQLKDMKDFSFTWEALSLIRLLLPDDYVRVRDSLALEAFCRLLPEFMIKNLAIRLSMSSDSSGLRWRSEQGGSSIRKAIELLKEQPGDTQCHPDYISVIHSVDYRQLYWWHVPCTNVSGASQVFSIITLMWLGPNHSGIVTVRCTCAVAKTRRNS